MESPTTPAAQFDRRHHDLCFAVAWRVLEFLRTQLATGDEQRECMAEIYEICLQEVDIYERARRRREEAGQEGT